MVLFDKFGMKIMVGMYLHGESVTVKAYLSP